MKPILSVLIIMGALMYGLGAHEPMYRYVQPPDDATGGHRYLP